MNATTYTIPAKMSNTGSIHDIATDTGDRVIRFGAGCKYAVIRASYYGGRGYTTHRSDAAAIAASKAQREYSHIIINQRGAQVEPYWHKGDLILVDLGRSYS